MAADPLLDDLLDMPSEDEGDVDVGASAKETAAQDLSSAVKKGDAKAIVSAFQRMYDLCAAKPVAAEEGEEDEEY